MKEKITISILGDICPAEGFRKEFDEKRADSIFGDVMPLLQNSDLAIANLEAALSKRGAPIKKCGPCLCGKPEDMEVLKKAGIDAVTMANNHILDYGEEALLDTFASADQNKIKYFGAGKNAENARKAAFFEIKGWKIGALGYAEEEFTGAYQDRSGANLFDPYISFDDISEAKAECDYLIVLYHGGIEHYAYPSPLLQKKCRKMVKAGADLVLCQHSHCIGTREKYGNGEILYGQGNAVFGKIEGYTEWNTGLLTTVSLSADTKTVTYRTFEATENGIRLASEEENEKRLTELKTESELLLQPEKIKDKWEEFCRKQQASYMPMLIGWNRVQNKLNRIFGNRLIKAFYSIKSQRVTMNLMRCDAHREVVQTILENNQKKAGH